MKTWKKAMLPARLSWIDCSLFLMMRISFAPASPDAPAPVSVAAYALIGISIDKARAFNDRKEKLQEKRDEREPEMEQRKALREEFTKAVAAQDADQIKAVLPKLLEQYKADTAKLAQRVQQLRSAQTQAQ